MSESVGQVVEQGEVLCHIAPTFRLPSVYLGGTGIEEEGIVLHLSVPQISQCRRMEHTALEIVHPRVYGG